MAKNETAPFPVAVVETPPVVVAEASQSAEKADNADAAQTAPDAPTIDADAAVAPVSAEDMTVGDAVAEPAVEIDEEAAAVTRDAELAELNSSLARMAHPDGGTCDLYATDEDGNILVPVTEVASMMDHGFVLVVAEG